MSGRFVVALVVVGGFATPGCSKAKEEPPAPGPVDPCAAGRSQAAQQAHGIFRWIEDDYASALACAKSKRLPLVIDLWAPWCHTCLSMQTTVFADKTLAPHADKFVFVALDTDRDVNAAAVAKYPMSAWPTFYVVSPDEAVLARFIGAASTAQFDAFLEAGARAMTGKVAGADSLLLEAERAIQAKDLATADKKLSAALLAAPADWVRKPDALVSLITTRYKNRDFERCVELAEQAMDDTGATASVTDFINTAMACGRERAAVDAERIARLRERAVVRLRGLVDAPTATLSLDDRSDALLALREILETLEKKDEARAVAEQQRTLLEDAAAKAPTPIAAMTFLWHRAEVHVYLGRALELVPSFEKLARELPKEYEPPARLGWIYLKSGKLDEAARWTDKAIALAYGPRKTRVLAQRADIAAAAGDRAAERTYRVEIVKTLETLPASQTTPAAIEDAKRAVGKLDGAP